MILIVNICCEKLHELEFVKPVEKLVGENYFTCKYDQISLEDLEKADKVIICGTSLRDNEYLSNLSNFSWIKDFEKPIFGICAGFQIIQMVFSGVLKEIKEIGQMNVEFSKDFLGISGSQKVYSLHQNFVSSEEFEIYAKSEKCAHAVKHKEKEIYATLFHPEVYNLEIIENFCKL